MTHLISIPGAAASRSKMQKKGWKCWAKWLSEVATPANDGYAYSGEFTTPGSDVECDIGGVLLHVDQGGTAALGVAMLNSKGEPFFKWIADASSEARKWCGPLAKPARQLLAMNVDERIKHVAGIIAADAKPDWTASVQDYWNALAGIAAVKEVDAVEVVDGATVDREALLAERETLLARIAEIDSALAP
jgi:hypothetical protein